MIQGISPAISAVKNLGKRIGTAANNVANVATSGFKKSRSSATTLPGYGVGTAAGTAQVGMGSSLGDIEQIFGQGAYEPAASPTQMAIGGNGFFVVKDLEGRSFYTRDGNFHFDRQGSLVNSQGMVAQGWAVNPETGVRQGLMQDITMSRLTSAPEQTTMMTAVVNLDADAGNRSAGENGLSAAWDGRDPGGKPISDQSYSYQTVSKVYDALGATHDITLYFDKGDTDSSWEYLVAMNPSEDKRAAATSAGKGLLARGTIQFNPSGEITNMTMETTDGSGSWTPQAEPADYTGGHFAFQPDFQGDPSGSTAMDIRLNIGARYDGNNWQNATPVTTQFAAPSSTVFSASNGYSAGELASIQVDPDGVVTGSYTNGNVVPLFQVAAATFQNPNGLDHVGNNLFAETRESGSALTNAPGTGGAGQIISNTLETSNVDLVEELTQLTLFKRSFQANLKVIEVENQLKGDVIDIIS